LANPLTRISDGILCLQGETRSDVSTLLLSKGVKGEFQLQYSIHGTLYIQMRWPYFQTLSECIVLVHPSPAFAIATSNSPLTYNMSSYGSSVYTRGDSSSVCTGGDDSHNGDRRPPSPVPAYSQYSHELPSGSVDPGSSVFSDSNLTVPSQNPSDQGGNGSGRGISQHWERRLHEYQNPGNLVTNTAWLLEQVGKNTVRAANNWRQGNGFTLGPQGGGRAEQHNDTTLRQGATPHR
jgi:hypothetical protein